MIKCKIWVITQFPELYAAFSDVGVIGQTLSGKRDVKIDLETVLLRDFSPKGFKGVDDVPYGGGHGMVMRADVLQNALMKGVVEAGQYGDNWREEILVIYTSPRGKVWDQSVCQEFAKRTYGKKDIVFICGRYEGIDERFIENYVDEIYSIGDYVLTGGDLAVMSMIDSSLRLIPGVLGNQDSYIDESFEDGLLEHPYYTRPAIFEEKKVPEVLTSGNHKKIAEYKMSEKERMTKKYRPDLFQLYKKREK